MFKRLECSIGQQLKVHDVVHAMAMLNYQRQDYVSVPGQFAVRGNIVDVYPFNFTNPVRIEFAFGSIDSIRDFNVETGVLGVSSESLILVPVHEQFAERHRDMPTEKIADEYAKAFFSLKEGDYVVHVDYGIGKYLGIRQIKVKGVLSSYFAIEYLDKEMLYVDLDMPHVIQRYVGVERRKPKLNRLNSKDWARTKARVKAAVRAVAHDMIIIQAKRQVRHGFVFDQDNDWQRQFEKQFPFTETEDQVRAIADVKADMQSDKPMDRLLCGDVGYGKTEVAMRAAFKAVMSGKQVAILVPTTILAEQHYLTLKRRVKQFPAVRVDSLSRFRTRKEIVGVLTTLKEGTCDIVVGTHRLLSADVQFKDLGLVIIDEEQRFGVRHKEKLKHMRAMIDVLTLTATPIPRTLYMALMGVRDMSVINTPPQNRMPITTEVGAWNDALVVQMFQRELARGGQVYFVHNRVQSIEHVHKKLTALLPNVRFVVAHGQMSGSELEEIMLAFMDGNADCLIATSIIESGIDIPNVNTIIIDRADHFGLADLYQLRGRVGRFHEKREAYAYLIVPKGYVLTEDAGKRLSAIERFTDLGSGFKIAMEDLEIRGAGNILGHEQSGHIYEIGFDLYCKLLREAIKEEEERLKLVS